MAMFNPQMMGMGMGQLPKMPTVEELWKDEKEKYRHWMILFGIGIIVVFSLLLASVILNSLDEANIKQQMIDYIYAHVGVADQPDALASVGRSFRTTYIIIPSVQIALVGVGALLFGSTLIQSYQSKSFHKLSGWGTMVIGIGVFFSIYQLFSLIGDLKSIFDTQGGVFQFVTYFIVIAVYFSGAMQVSRIRRTFAQAHRIEQIKNSPEYQAMQQQMNAMQNGQMPNGFANGPFGPTMGTAQGAAPQPNGQPQGATKAAPAKSSERLDLESMSVTDLKKVAKKLEISGSSTMKKPELIDAILRVTENN